MVEKVTKRNGENTDFSIVKIKNALIKACDAVGELDKSFIAGVVESIKNELNLEFPGDDASVSVEKIQDISEIELMKAGKYHVARAYIVYRDKRTAERIQKHQKLISKFENNTLKVTKSNGSKELFRIEKIKNTFDIAVVGYEKTCQFEELIEAFKRNIVDDIKTSDISKLLVKTCIDLVSINNIHWLEVASRFASGDLYKKASKTRGIEMSDIYTKESYVSLFKEYVDKGLYYKDFFNYYTEEDILKAGSHIDKNRDKTYTYSTILSLSKRYLLNPNKVIKELPQEMYMSVALFLAIPEKDEDRLKFALKIYDQCSSQKISLPTPTLINARTNWNQLSSCFKMNIDDDLRAIYHSIENMAQISKFGGGIGVYLGNIRASGSSIRGIHGAAGGVNPWVKVINDTAIAVNQLGARLGAISVTLDSWHLDIYDFLDLQVETGDIRSKSFDIFPAVSMPDLFMQRVKEDGEWSLFDPHEIKKVYGKSLQDFYGKEFEEFYHLCEQNEALLLKKTVPAKDLFKKFLKTTVETGMPYVFFRDTVNEANPNKHAGMVYSSQLCVTGDTRISSEFGLVTVKELHDKMKETPFQVNVDNRTVNLDNKEKGVQSLGCIGIYKTAELADVYEVVTKAGYKIKATEWHKFYRDVSNKIEKVDLKELKIGDNILIQSGEGKFGNIGTYETGKNHAASYSNITKYIPEDIYRGSKESVSGYLNGLFNTHGNNASTRDIVKISLESRERDFVSGVQVLISLFGIKSNISEINNNGQSYYVIEISGNNVIKFINLIGIDSYKSELLAYVDSVDDNISEIVSITYAGKEDVYDTTQNDHHSLIFNGIVTGNCTEIAQNTAPAKFKSETTENGEIVIRYTPGDLVVCNLASINMAKVYTEKEMKEAFPTVMRILDNVITLNFYPIEETRITAMKYRSVGLGYLGLAEYLATHGYSYDSAEARDHVNKLFDKYSYYMYKASVNLAKERGSYGLYEGSEYSKGKLLNRDVSWYENNSVIPEKWVELFGEMKSHGVRFAYHSAPAPNTSTSSIVGTTAALLPIYKKYFVETNLSAPTIRVAPKLSADNFWHYKEYTNMDMNDVIDMIATIYPWIDQAISFEWMIDPAKVSPAQLYGYYMKAWESKIKTVYYVRSLSGEVGEGCVSCSG